MHRLIYLLVFLVLSTMGFAANPVCPNRPIRLAFYELHGFYHNGQGYDKDVVDELIRRSGCRFETMEMPRVRIWADITAGTLDMTTSGIVTPERQGFAWFAVYIAEKNYALLASNVPKQIDSIEAFLAQPTLRLGVVRGFRYEIPFLQWREEQRALGRLDEVADINQLFMMFKAKRFVAMMAPPIVFRSVFRELGIGAQVRVADWLPKEKPSEVGLVLSKKVFSQAEAEKWQMLIKEMHDDGTLKKLLLRYLPPEEVEEQLEF